MKKLFSLFAAVLMAGSMMATTVTVDIAEMRDSLTTTYLTQETEKTVDGVTFLANGVAKNGKGTPSGWAFNQVLQMKKSGAGYVINKESMSLVSLHVVAKSMLALDIKAGTSASELTSLDLADAETTTVTYTDVNGNEATDNTFVEITLDLSGKNFVKIMTKLASYVYEATLTYEVADPNPLTFEVAKSAESITITPSDPEAPYYVAVLDPSLPSAFAFYNDSTKLATYANVIAGIESQAALTAASVTGVKTITLAEYTTEGFYQVVAGAMHYDATAEGNINGFVIDSEVASENFTVEAPVVLDPATWYGTTSFTTGGAVINPAVTANVDYEITRNANMTLTISCTIDADVTGLVPQVNLAGFHNLDNVEGVWTYTTTETYTDGDEITVELYMAYAGAASSIPVVYTVGSANTKPVTFTFAAGEAGVVTVTPSIEEVNYAYVFCNQAILDTYAELGIATERDFLEAMIATVEDISDIVAFGEDDVDIHDFAGVMSNTLDYQLTTGTYTLLVIALNVELDEDDDVVITPVGEMARFEGVSYNATTTAVENVEAVKAVKVIENGQVVIIREGVRYNVAGLKL